MVSRVGPLGRLAGRAKPSVRLRVRLESGAKSEGWAFRHAPRVVANAPEHRHDFRGQFGVARGPYMENRIAHAHLACQESAMLVG